MVDSDDGGSDEGSDGAPRRAKRPRTAAEPGAGASRGKGSKQALLQSLLGSADTCRGVAAGTGSVCKLFVKKVPANFADPWRKHSQQSSSGTGFLVGGRWIVTNAHVIHRAVSVLVRATSGPPIKYNARVAAVGLPCDLAVLTVDDEFWRGKESLELSSTLPRLDDNVTCIGFPVGGDNISVTRGVVSRIDVAPEGTCRIQIDAAINPGNSGGPVMGAHGLVVGVAAAHLKHASNIGYIIPTAVLQQFLECANSTNGECRYIGHSSMGIARVQPLEAPALRKRLGLPDGFTGGVRVPAVWPIGPAVGKLQVDDVIVALDGVEIGQDATVPLRDNERIHFMHLVTRRLAGRDVVKLKVMRGGSEIEVEIALRPDRWLVPRIDGYDAAPEYCIVGGLTFVPLSQPWAELKGNDKAARNLILQYWGNALPEEGRQVVILSKVLAHPCNFGFHNISNIVLSVFNSEPVHNLAQLAKLVGECQEEHYVFEFLRPAGDGKELVVLDRAVCVEAEPQILEQHLIASPSMVRCAGGSVRDLQPSGRTPARNTDDAVAATSCSPIQSAIFRG